MSDAHAMEMSQEKYHRHKAISQSGLKRFRSSPLDYYELHVARTRKPKVPTVQQQFGSRVEDFLRRRLTTDNVVIIPEDVLTSNGQKRGKKYDAFLAEQPEGVTLMTQKEYDAEFYALDKISQNVTRCESAKWLIEQTQSTANLKLFWDCPITGRRRRCELDGWIESSRHIIDIKTAADISPDGFAKAAASWGYHIQEATYREAVIQWTGYEPIEFFFVVIKNDEPYDVAVYWLHEEFVDIGHTFNREWMPRLDRAMREDNWHRPAEPVRLDPPRWLRNATAQEDELMGLLD